ncbi:1-phosphofructokinase [Candidatus Clostridium radicumherbarum]|uniref:Tagatose-6-phosphate kinase n=1 Tax=Candidatus Clostridium radicumherbarum TaxID=3381662 RepID=A0ABW8TLH3_9CLOT
MVITVTLNPALDKTLTIDNFNLGIVNRAGSIRYDIGGKGINVSKVLKNFNIDSVCTGFLGGVWENYFQDELKKRKIDTSFVHIEGSTRTNTKVVDSINKVYTDINEAGPEITNEELNCFLEKFEALCSKGDIVVLSGGVSASIPIDIYGKLIKLAKKKGAVTVLDADGELLKHGLKEKPDLIKPNIHELQKLMDFQKEDEETVINAAKQLIETGVKKVLVSLGEKGAIYVTKAGINSCEGLKVNVKSTVGAGDSMVAALVYSLINSLSDEETLAFANACGAASVETEGTEACSLEEVNKLVQKVKIRHI